MSTSISDAVALKSRLIAAARKAGFDEVRITTPDAAPDAAPRLDAFLKAGRHGTMGWMADTAARRRRPRALWPEVRSIALLREVLAYHAGLADFAFAMAVNLGDLRQLDHRRSDCFFVVILRVGQDFFRVVSQVPIGKTLRCIAAHVWHPFPVSRGNQSHKRNKY
jgi:hypothetical protein